MKTNQFLRLLLVCSIAAIWVVSAVWLHNEPLIKTDHIMNWVLSILVFPVSILLVMFIVLIIWQSVESIADFIKYGPDGN